MLSRLAGALPKADPSLNDSHARFHKPLLYPLSYGGSDASQSRRNMETRFPALQCGFWLAQGYRNPPISGRLAVGTILDSMNRSFLILPSLLVALVLGGPAGARTFIATADAATA